MFYEKVFFQYTSVIVGYNDKWRVPKYRRWTRTSADCYRRGCRCGATENSGECPDLQFCLAEHANFRLKEVVRRMVTELGTDRIESDLQKAQEENYDADLFL